MSLCGAEGTRLKVGSYSGIFILREIYGNADVRTVTTRRGNMKYLMETEFR